MIHSKVRGIGVLVLFILTCFTSNLLAQSKLFEEIRSVKLRDIGVIKNENLVSGYYMFYEVDKVDRKNRKYLLEIMDENLETVAKKNITLSKYISLVDAAFNYQHIMLKFFDTKEKKYSFKSYDLKGEKAKGASRDYDRKEYRQPLFMVGEGTLLHEGAFFSVPDAGFVQYAATKNKKWGYIIDFIGPDRESSWKYRSKKEDKMIHVANYLMSNEDMLISSVNYFKGAFGKDSQSGILAIDVKTGKKMFEKKLGDKKPSQIINGFIDEDKEEILIFGLYYREGAKISVKEKSRGLAIYRYDYNGDLKDKKYISWEKDVAKHLKMNAKGKMDGGKYINFHNIVKTADGKILAIGEQYARKLDGLSLAATMLTGTSGGAGMTKLVIEDMIVFKLDEEANLEDVQIFEKNRSNVNLGVDYSPQVMAWLAQKYGAFDYTFTQNNEDNSLVTFGYVDYERVKGARNGYVYGTVSYVDGEFVTDTMKLERRKKLTVSVFPAIPGYVMLAEYDGKAKTLDLKLEQINY